MRWHRPAHAEASPRLRWIEFRGLPDLGPSPRSSAFLHAYDRQGRSMSTLSATAEAVSHVRRGRRRRSGDRPRPGADTRQGYGRRTWLDGRRRRGPRPRGRRRRPAALARLDVPRAASPRRCASRSSAPTARCATSTSTHEKRMHLIVVRRDLTGFQHLHPDARRRRHLARAAHARRRRRLPGVRRLRARRRARTRSAPTCASTAPPTCAPLPAPRPRAARDRRLRRRGSTRGRRATLRFAITRDGAPVDDRAVPRRRRPPRRAARGRPRLPARAPDDERRRRRSRPSSRARAATGCSCSSSTTAASTPPRSPARWRWPTPTTRAADHGHDVRVVREPDRAQAQQARRRHRDGQLRDREGDGRLRPGGGRARRARRRGRGRRLQRDAARPAAPRRAADEPTRPRRCAAG